MNKIVAIVGMCGSGKSVASEYLENTLGYQKVYFGGVTMKKYLKKNPPINEQMIKAMMSGMGRTPSQKQINQMMKQMNKFM